MSSQVRRSLKNNKETNTLNYLGCDIITYKKYLEAKFGKNMTWDNYGEWEIDHIIPVKYKNPSLEEVKNRLHYTNTQPMWKYENLRKGNRTVCGIIHNHSLYDGYESC